MRIKLNLMVVKLFILQKYLNEVILLFSKFYLFNNTAKKMLPKYTKNYFH